MELVMVGGTPHLMPAAEFLDHHRRYLAQVLSEAGGNSLMEVGAGELNTLLPVLALLPSRPEEVIALDISEARLKAGQPYDKAGHVTKYITASAADIPLPDKSVDVIFTNHCLEQSPKLVAPALREFARVCRKRIILTEPAYELAHPLQRKRIRKLGYVRGIPSTARRLGLNVVSHELLPVRRYRNGSAMTIIDI
jgi:SAM-dependent methyltransferase